MHIYQLTQLGHRLARTTNNPDTTNWRVLHEMDKLDYATTDQLVIATGLEENEITGAVAVLKRKQLIQER